MDDALVCGTRYKGFESLTSHHQFYVGYGIVAVQRSHDPRTNGENVVQIDHCLNRRVQ